MLILGLSNMRDAAAALVQDGRILAAAEEERFVRVKHVTALPVQAMTWCLRQAGVSLADVDAIADGTRCVIGGVMQHIEDAGIHSGDSACVLPPYLITEAQVDEMRRYTRAFAERLGVVGLLNVQYAIKNGVVYVLEVNPRGSRTVPFVSKTTGVQLAGLAQPGHRHAQPGRPVNVAAALRRHAHDPHRPLATLRIRFG